MFLSIFAVNADRIPPRGNTMLTARKLSFSGFFLCDAKIIENLTFVVSCCILYVYLCDGYVMKKYFCLFENITCMIQVITVFL